MRNAHDKGSSCGAPDIDEALAQMGESFDIAREDLDRLLQYAEASALRRQARSS
ncbi:hypothetical protein [Bosea sp. (in: a-proteobacteria)]|uniref:hypothetical protein n=1 Tax=Bosea sp. (in: a-proteobacteria) TaxID=1871050 RepID=UPI0025BD4B45|nr:hypothetical protein [Bosea sp. (in: a-proteobacteria)]MBR3189650.1 hypothetical protein [Bosea sp. (in: a-proteobacteria)]